MEPKTERIIWDIDTPPGDTFESILAELTDL